MAPVDAVASQSSSLLEETVVTGLPAESSQITELMFTGFSKVMLSVVFKLESTDEVAVIVMTLYVVVPLIGMIAGAVYRPPPDVIDP